MENNERLMSEHIDQLATALAKAQGEFNVAGLNQKNPFFKSNYADFLSVIEASRPALSKHGLSVIQSPFVEPDGNSYLITVLMHASGQWIKSKAKHNPQKNDIQALASYNTYLKRMCYASLVGVSTGEIDDDAEAAMIRPMSPPLTQTEIDYLTALDTDKQITVKNYFNVKNITDLNYNQYLQVKKKYSN